MKSHTLILYADSRLEHFQWLMVEQGVPQRVWSGDRAALQHSLRASAQAGVSCVAILPVEVALHSLVEVPRKQRRFLARTLPYIIEGQTAQAIEDLHIVVGNYQQGDHVSVLAVPHAYLEELISLCRDGGQHLSAIHIDSEVLSKQEPGAMHISWYDDRLLVSALGRGFSCARSNVAGWIERAVPDGNAQATVHLTLSPERRTEGQTLEAELMQSFGEVPSAKVGSSELLEQLVQAWQAPGRITNLLSGPYEPDTSLAKYRPYIPVGVTAAALMVFALVLHTVTETRQMAQQAETHWRLAAELYAQASGDDRPFNRVQFRPIIESRLNQAGSTRGDAVFLAYLQKVNQAMQGVEVQLQELRYAAERGDLQMQVVAPSTAELEVFRRQLEEQQIQVSYSAGRVDSGFRGNFQLQWQGGGL